MIRAFVAVDLPPENRRCLREISGELERLRLEARFPSVDSIHLTLKFLGSIAGDRIPEIGSVLEASAGAVPPFELTIRRLGVFPQLANPRIVWVGIDESLALKELQNRIERGLKSLGFPPEDRAYQPHLTLARLKSRKHQDSLIRLLRQQGDRFDAGSFRVAAVHLFQSILGPRQAEYRKRLSVPLEEAGRAE